MNILNKLKSLFQSPKISSEVTEETKELEINDAKIKVHHVTLNEIETATLISNVLHSWILLNSIKPYMYVMNFLDKYPPNGEVTVKVDCIYEYTSNKDILKLSKCWNILHYKSPLNSDVINWMKHLINN